MLHPGERGHRTATVQRGFDAVDLFAAVHRVGNLGPHLGEQRGRVPNVFAAVIKNLSLFVFRPWTAGQDQPAHLVLVLLVARGDAVQRADAEQAQRRKVSRRCPSRCALRSSTPSTENSSLLMWCHSMSRSKTRADMRPHSASIVVSSAVAVNATSKVSAPRPIGHGGIGSPAR